MSTHQVFIASYAKDFPWLRVCLSSLKRFSVGFLPPVVCVEGRDYPGAQKICEQVFPEARVVVSEGRVGQGFMRAQISMMGCDLLSPDNADFYYLLGSDCMAFKQTQPEQYFFRGLPVMLWTGYAERAGHLPDIGVWKSGTEAILGWPVPNEYMRRLPLVYPRELFAPFRAHVEGLHHLPFQEFIYKAFSEGCRVSESNLMGAFAARHMPGIYSWLHEFPHDPEYAEYWTEGVKSITQFWSHGGLDHPVDGVFSFLFLKNKSGQTPREVIREVLGNGIV